MTRVALSVVVGAVCVTTHGVSLIYTGLPTVNVGKPVAYTKLHGRATNNAASAAFTSRAIPRSPLYRASVLASVFCHLLFESR